MVTDLPQDLHYAFRILKKNPLFASVAILMLALGIGITTAVFSVVNAVLLQPLLYPAPNRLIWLSQDAPGCHPDCFVSRADFRIWEKEAHSFESMALIGNSDQALEYRGEASTERIGSIEGDFWKITNAQPRFGRLFGAHQQNVIVLSWGLFERRFHRDPKAIGKSVVIEGHPFTIVGVLPKTFRDLFPQALYTGDEIRQIGAYIPTPPGDELPGSPIKPNPSLGPSPPWFRVAGLLKPNVSFAHARAEMRAIWGRVRKEYPNPTTHRQKLRFETVKDRLVGRIRPILLVLFGAAGFVLLIALANLANLLLARGSARAKEIAIRAAVGAGRWRVIRQFLTESIALALLGGGAGIALAYFSLGLVMRFGSAAVPRLNEARLDGSVLLFAVVVSFMAGILFGIAPAITLARTNLDAVLKQDARTSSASTGQLRLRRLFIAGEVALAMTLLIAAGLMLKSLWKMSSYPPGLKPDKILTMRISLSSPQYNRNWPQQRSYLQRLCNRLRTLTGVEQFGIECGRFTQPVQIEGIPPNAAKRPLDAGVRYVSPGYLRALGIPLLKGRWPKNEDEMLDSVVVNERLAREAGISNILGRRIQGPLLNGTVVGVVADFKDSRLDVEPSPQAYTAYAMAPVIRSVRIMVRTSADPKSIESPLRKLVSGIDTDVPVFQMQTLAQELSNSIAPRRFDMALLATFAGSALLLALVGIYGVISYLVAQRTSEVGIRMALGAQRIEIVCMVLKQGMGTVFLGIFIGTAASLGLTRLMATMVYEVKPSDPLTFSAVATMLAATAFVACLVPALRAAFVDPAAALRHE